MLFYCTWEVSSTALISFCLQFTFNPGFSCNSGSSSVHTTLLIYMLQINNSKKHTYQYILFLQPEKITHFDIWS